MDGQVAAGDDAMTSSANAMTKKLYLTVMDVFGNYAEYDEGDYNKMLETIGNKQTPKKKCRTPANPDDIRGVIANKLLEGYVLQGDVCDKCVMPLMAHNGHVTCVMCETVEEVMDAHVSASAGLMTEPELELASTSESDSSEVKREDMVCKELTQFNDRRAQATHVYTAKILAGYVMQEEMCASCDMPMMKYNDSVDCAFCPKTTKKEVPMSDAVLLMNPVVIVKSLEELKPMKQRSQGEILAERLRGAKSNGSSENAELEKAEYELLEMIRMQDNQNDEVGEAIQEYFNTKKADRAAMRFLKEAENVILEAEIVAASDALNGINDSIPQAAARVVSEPIVALDNEKNDVFTKHGPTHHIIDPPTPKFKPSISCSIGDSFFPSLKSLFATKSQPINMNEVHTKANTPHTCRLEARKRIGMFVAEGWEVSADNCPHCELPLFSNSINGPKRCVMCGPMNNIANYNHMQGQSREPNKASNEDVTKTMVDRVMEGWSIIEGQQCPSCHMPTMFDPKAQLTNCVACGVLNSPSVPTALMQQQAINSSADGGPGSFTLNMRAMQSKINALSLSEMNPNGKDSAHSAMHAMQRKLTIEIAPESSTNTLPDPTTSMYDLREQYGQKPVDPTPSMQILHSKLNVMAGTQSAQLRMGAPTPATKTVRLKFNEPTPNMQAVRSKALNLAVPEPTHYTTCDPTPNMYTVRGKNLDQMSSTQDLQCSINFAVEDGQKVQWNEPTPAMRTLRSSLNEPTPNMQSVRNKVNEMSYTTPSDVAARILQGKYNSLSESAPTHHIRIGSVDPPPQMMNY